MEEELFLGTVGYVHPSDGSSHGAEFCKIRPTHRRKNGSWVTILNSAEEFPDDGLVFWWGPDDVVKGAARIFSVARSPSYDGARRKDVYQVGTTIERPLELLSIPGIKTNAQLRRILASDKFSPEDVPIGVPLIRLPEDASEETWIGPIECKVVDDRMESRPKIQFHIDSGFVRIHRVDSGSIQDIFIEGRSRKFLRPDVTVQRDIGLFCAQSDEDLLQSLLTRIRRWSPGTAEALGVTKRVLDSYIATFVAQNLVSDDLARETARAEAAQKLVLQMVSSYKQSEEIINAFYASPKIAQSISEKVEAEVVAKRKERERDIDAELTKERLALVDLQAKITGTEKQLTDTEMRLARAVEEEKEKTEKIEKIASELFAKCIGNAEEQIVSRLMENSIIRTLSTRFQSREGQKDVAVRDNDSSARPYLTDVAEFRPLVGPTAVQFGVDSANLAIAIALAAASGILYTFGDCASSLARATALLIGGPSARVVYISPATFSVSDLMSSPISPVGDQSVEPESLGDFLAHRSRTGAVSVVVLEGVNRAPFESALRDIVTALKTNGGARAIPYRKSNGSEAYSVIGNGTIFLGALVHGETTFSIPVEYATSFPVLLAEKDRSPPGTSETFNVSSGFSVQAWKELNAPLPATLTSALGQIAANETLATVEGMDRFVSRAAAVIGDADRALIESVIAFSCGRLSEDHLKGIGSNLSERIRKTLDGRIQAAQFEAAAKYFEKRA